MKAFVMTSLIISLIVLNIYSLKKTLFETKDETSRIIEYVGSITLGVLCISLMGILPELQFAAGNSIRNSLQPGNTCEITCCQPENHKPSHTMNIYTSYYSSPILRKFPSDEIVPVSISLYPPKNWTGHHYLPLCPSSEIFREVKSTGNHRTYVRQLLEQFEKLDPAHVLHELEHMSGGKPVVLLCFEKPKPTVGDDNIYCHRQVVARWLSSKLGIVVPELTEFTCEGCTCENRTSDEIPLF